MLKFMLLIVTLISSVVLVTLTMMTPDGEKDETEYTLYASISPIGKNADHYLIIDYEIIDDNWIRLNEPNGKSMIINTHNYNVVIEKTVSTPEFQKTKSLLEQRLNGTVDTFVVPK